MKIVNTAFLRAILGRRDIGDVAIMNEIRFNWRPIMESIAH